MPEVACRCWRLLRIMQWSVGLHLQAVERSKTVRRETLPVKCKEYMAAARPQHHNCINVYPPPLFKKNPSFYYIDIFLFSAVWRTKWSDCESVYCSVQCAWMSFMTPASFPAITPCAVTASSASSSPQTLGACFVARSVAEMCASPGEGSQSFLSTFLFEVFRMNWGMKPKLAHARFVTAVVLHPSSAALTVTLTSAASAFMNTALCSTKTPTT